MTGSVAYILMGYPRVSETFIASEIHRVEQAGVPLRLYVIKPVEEREQGHRHPVQDAIAAQPEYLPDPTLMTQHLHRWRLRHVREFLPPVRRCLRDRRSGSLRAIKTMAGQLARDRRHLLSPPRKLYLKELLQAFALADRLLDAPDVRHLKAIAPAANVHLVYHGLSADFTSLLKDGGAPERNGRLRILGVGRLVAKKGFDTLVDACAVLRDRGVPFDALIVGQDDTDGEALRRRIAALDVPVQLPGPVGPAALLDEYRRADALCMPCRLLPTDRDGIPNVLVEAMAAGAPVVATAVSGIPELVEHEVNGLLIAPDDPEALADALLRLHADPELTARLTRNGRETVKERFDGERLAGELAALFTEAVERC